MSEERGETNNIIIAVIDYRSAKTKGVPRAVAKRASER
jgi:hypothetical protein